jgi:peptidoglycan hydrolase-like protein with peptidoglycan-binding domain
MGSDLTLLIVGFVLTTVVGGFLGYQYQRRTWQANRRESEREAASAVFDEISRAMDRRLYRMRRLYWSVRDWDDQRVDESLSDYREILRDWNDNLNRNLALVYRYFGPEVWRYVDGVLYEEFAYLGLRLERRVRHHASEESASEPAHALTGRRLKALSNDVYELNRFLIAQVQLGTVGLYQEGNGVGVGPLPWRRDVQRGTKSLLVADWQRALNSALDLKLDVDGWFGEATHEATIQIQQRAGLPANGIVDAATRSALATTRDAPP